MKKEIKIKNLELDIKIYHKDFRKWNRPWTWGHKALASWVRFCGVVLNYRLFCFSIRWRFSHKGYELYDIEFIPKGAWGRLLPYWDTWKVKNKEKLLERLDDAAKTNKNFTPLRYILKKEK